MRRFVVALLLACTAASAHAAPGINLRWDACVADGGVRNKTFACDTNTGSEKLVVSFQLPADLTQVTGIEAAVDIPTPNTLPPAWWALSGAGACRNGSLSLVFGPAGDPVGCENAWWAGAPAGGVTYGVAFNGANFYRLSLIGALAPNAATDLWTGTEYVAGTVTLSHAKTVGTSACPGCADPVCLGLRHVKLSRPVGVGDIQLSAETAPNSSTVNWQGASAGSWLYEDPLFPATRPSYRIVTCDAAVPARNHTWGAIKSLYR